MNREATAVNGIRASRFGTAVRLFLTCWMIYVLHVATNTVREIYPALAMAEHGSFRVDEYANLHPDLFEKPGYGWHINSNPGASMLAAVPYALFRPVADKIVQSVNRARKGGQPPEYQSPWPMAREFYKRAWLRGYDVKFGLAAILMQATVMAPISAFGAVAMFYLLLRLFGDERYALWLALLYALGTPIFFRTGYLNQNLLVAQFALFGYVGLLSRWPLSRRMLAGGLAGGAALLMDYSGVVVLLALGLYAAWLTWSDGRSLIRTALLFGAGTLPPLLLLFWYQWQSFGHPLLPAQAWMPRIAYTDVGFNGVGWPDPALLAANLFDYRFGLFTSCPLLLLAFGALFPGPGRVIVAAERMLVFLLAAGFALFSSCVGYAWLQFNTGVRYMVPAVPFLFVGFAATFLALSPRWRYFLSVVAIAQAWSMAMYRDVERGLGVLEPPLHVLIGGFQLPLLTVLSRMGPEYGEYVSAGVSPLPLFTLAGALIYGIWAFPARRVR